MRDKKLRITALTFATIMRWTLLIFFLLPWLVQAQSIPNLRVPWVVSHLSGTNKTMLYRVGAPKHNAITRVICFKTPCRGVIGWKKTQQRNKFKGYKKPGIPRLKYLKRDSLNAIERQPSPSPIVEDTVSVVPSEPIMKDSVISFVFDDVLFETNSSNLNDAFKKRLDSLSVSIRKYENYRIRVVGHTDNSGRERSNSMLSQQRAEAVALYLVSNGISSSQITAEGRGSGDPIADNATIEGRQKNRRVQIFLSFD
jgi:outer membrane protein OmpA-like peptidoglycan-associated protein